MEWWLLNVILGKLRKLFLLWVWVCSMRVIFVVYKEEGRRNKGRGVVLCVRDRVGIEED